MPAVGGWGGVTTGTQYQLFVNAPHEAMGLAGLDVTWGHTGRLSVGAPDFTTLSPTFDFGKGFGDLPNSLPWLRPFALTGNLSFDFPTQTETGGMPNSNNFNYGFAIEYSLEYLQHHVKDIGLQAPYDRLIPLVEFRPDFAVQPRPDRVDDRHGAARSDLGRAILSRSARK